MLYEAAQILLMRSNASSPPTGGPAPRSPFLCRGTWRSASKWSRLKAWARSHVRLDRRSSNGEAARLIHRPARDIMPPCGGVGVFSYRI